MEQFQVKGRTLVIRMPKELDHHTTGQIPGIADRMIGEKNIQRIEFDFRDTGFMDSSGIGVIMGRYQKLRLLGGSVAVTHVSDRIWRILHLAGVTKVIEVEKERNWKKEIRSTLRSDSIKNTKWPPVLYALKDFLIKRLGSLLEHTT